MKRNKGLTRAQQKRIKQPEYNVGTTQGYFEECYVSGKWELVLHEYTYNTKNIQNLIEFLKKADKYLKEVNCETK